MENDQAMIFFPDFNIPHAEVLAGEAREPRSIRFRIRQPFEARLRRAPQGEGEVAWPGVGR